MSERVNDGNSNQAAVGDGEGRRRPSRAEVFRSYFSSASQAPSNNNHHQNHHAVTHRERTNSHPLVQNDPPEEHGSVSSRQCWICFATDEDDTTLMWVQPCYCKGTTKWVHQGCLQQWVDEKQKENRDRRVSCPQCKTEYIIFFPKAHKLVILLDKIDALVYKICPFMAAGIMVGSLYWTAVTYGAITVMQVAGPNEAMQVMDRMEPTVLLMLLPVIPVGLVVLKMVHWEDSLLVLLRKASQNLPILNHILPGPVMNESGAVTEMPVSDGMSCTRVFTGALTLPTISTIVGNMFFQSVSSPFQRALLGGLTFIAVKGVVKMYHKQQTYKRLSKRRILDYTEENKKKVGILTF